MLVGYLDESTDGKKEVAYGMGGFLATQREWLNFERLWKPTDDRLRARTSRCSCLEYAGATRAARQVDIISIIGSGALKTPGRPVRLARRCSLNQTCDRRDIS